VPRRGSTGFRRRGLSRTLRVGSPFLRRLHQLLVRRGYSSRLTDGSQRPADSLKIRAFRLSPGLRCTHLHEIFVGNRSARTQLWHIRAGLSRMCRIGFQGPHHKGNTFRGNGTGGRARAARKSDVLKRALLLTLAGPLPDRRASPRAHGVAMRRAPVLVSACSIVILGGVAAVAQDADSLTRARLGTLLTAAPGTPEGKGLLPTALAEARDGDGSGGARREGLGGSRRDATGRRRRPPRPRSRAYRRRTGAGLRAAPRA
jgi:hypothetical protein